MLSQINPFGTSNTDSDMLITRKKEVVFILLLVPFYFYSLFSVGTSDVDYFAAWAREFVRGNFYELYQLNSNRLFEYSIGQNTTSTYPYPPIAVISLGIVALSITHIFGDFWNTYIFSANLLSLLALICISLILYRDGVVYGGSFRYKVVHFLLNPFVLLLFVLLGYQDAVSGLLVLIAMKLLQIKRYLLAGFFLALAVFTKQLSLLVLLPSILVISFSGAKTLFRYISGFFLGSALAFSPFMFSHNILDVFSKLLQSSVHNTISANAYNFPWFINMVRSLFAGRNIFDIQTQGIPLDSFTVWKAVSAYDFFSAFYLLFLFFFGIALVKYHKISIVNLPLVSVICVLGYYLFAPSVHENHFLFILPLLMWALAPRDAWIFHFLTTIAGINCFLRYGIGRNWSKELGFHAPSFEFMNFFGLTSFFCTFIIFIYLIFRLFHDFKLDQKRPKRNSLAMSSIRDVD